MNISARGVSIIVCCYNSALRLPTTLKYIAGQQVPDHVAWEVIVVNNGSKDNTTAVAQQEWEAYKLAVPFKVVDQPIAGLSAAREKGLEVSQYEYMLWCDDDNWLAPDYVARSFELMEAHPNVAMLGGLAIGAFDEHPPAWFEDKKFLFAVGPQLPKPGLLPRAQGYIYGAGAVIRKSSWVKIEAMGFQPLSSDRKGQALSGGHDVEMGLAFRLAGYDLYYDDALTFQHYMPRERMTDDYLIRLATGSSTSNMASIIYYFFFRHDKLSQGRFLFLYLKRLVAIFLQLLGNKKVLFSFLTENSPKSFLINHLEIWMLWQNFKMSFMNWPAAIAGFKKIKQFQVNFRNHTHFNA